LPAQYVRAVVKTPHGSHPGGMYGMGVGDLEGYAEDLDWILACRQAFRKPETADAWVKEWILDVPTHEAYLAKVGYAKTMEIKGRADGGGWGAEVERVSGGMAGAGGPASASERMVAAAARMLQEKVRANGYQSFLAGVGNSNLAAWLAAYELKRDGVDVELMA